MSMIVSKARARIAYRRGALENRISTIRSRVRSKFAGNILPRRAAARPLLQRRGY